jgi:uracil-DNA glycosylase
LLAIVSSNLLRDFLQLLKKSRSGAVFNPWWEFDGQNDLNRNAPAIRRNQLHAYLQQRLGRAKLAIIGEALGYRGGHFSGIPMTSERILLGKKKEIVAALYERRTLKQGTRNGRHRPPPKIIASIKPRRTSKPSVCPNGFSEPTATIVWGTLLKLGLRPEQFVLWNAFPWHSFDSRRGMLSNRMPTKSELPAGLTVLKAFLELFPCEQVVALGKIAAAQLEKLNVEAQCVRHPASGGAKLFRQQIANVFARSN